MTLACSIWSPVVIASCFPLSAAAECPLEPRRMEWNGPLCSLPSVSPWQDLAVFHEATGSSWKARSRRQGLGAGPQTLLSWGFAGPERLGKARTNWPHKTQALLFTEGRPVSLGVLVASSRHWIQGDLLEGNLVLTSPLIRFIGRKSGAHRINRRQRNRFGKGARPREPRAWVSGAVWPGCQTWWRVAPHYPPCLPGRRDKGPVRSVRSDCPDPACVLVTRK